MTAPVWIALGIGAMAAVLLLADDLRRRAGGDGR
jgi:hypothetical protein